MRGKDRAFWVWLARSWDGWRGSLIVVQPATVVRWHRQGFKYYWAWKSRHKGDVERVIGTLRRDCIDHVIVFNDIGIADLPR